MKREKHDLQETIAIVLNYYLPVILTIEQVLSILVEVYTNYLHDGDREVY